MQENEIHFPSSIWIQKEKIGGGEKWSSFLTGNCMGWANKREEKFSPISVLFSLIVSLDWSNVIFAASSRSLQSHRLCSIQSISSWSSRETSCSSSIQLVIYLPSLGNNIYIWDPSGPRQFSPTNSMMEMDGIDPPGRMRYFFIMLLGPWSNLSTVVTSNSLED